MYFLAAISSKVLKKIHRDRKARGIGCIWNLKNWVSQEKCGVEWKGSRRYQLFSEMHAR